MVVHRGPQLPTHSPPMPKSARVSAAMRRRNERLRIQEERDRKLNELHMQQTWVVPANEWHGQTCFILGGGPSLKGFDVERLRGNGRVIGVNEAGLTLAPWCDILFFCDRRWLNWNQKRLDLHQGDLKVTKRRTTYGPYILSEHPVRTIRTQIGHGFSHDPAYLGGWCSGGSAINLASLLGASPVILLGFDMHDYPTDQWHLGNWHLEHKAPPRPGSRQGTFVPYIEAMVPDLERRRTEVINCTPGSGLTCFPMGDINDYV